MIFTTPRVAPSTSAHNEWLHLDPFTYTDPRTGDRYEVKTGALTDGASIPRFLWSLIGSPMVDSRIFKGASIHDQCYKSLGIGGLFSRKECDLIFHRALIDAGLPPLQAATYYLGVRLGGWIGWKRYSQNPEEVIRQTALIEYSMEPG